MVSFYANSAGSFCLPALLCFVRRCLIFFKNSNFECVLPASLDVSRWGSSGPFEEQQVDFWMYYSPFRSRVDNAECWRSTNNGCISKSLSRLFRRAGHRNSIETMLGGLTAKQNITLEKEFGVFLFRAASKISSYLHFSWGTLCSKFSYLAGTVPILPSPCECLVSPIFCR